ncbi:MAG: hypothetical protein JWO28_1361, partial [Hyphomicrobiales bacterium]|nr:hypothetical protein [Hyphomicrobiales bacterium]
MAKASKTKSAPKSAAVKNAPVPHLLGSSATMPASPEEAELE